MRITSNVNQKPSHTHSLVTIKGQANQMGQVDTQEGLLEGVNSLRKAEGSKPFSQYVWH